MQFQYLVDGIKIIHTGDFAQILDVAAIEHRDKTLLPIDQLLEFGKSQLLGVPSNGNRRVVLLVDLEDIFCRLGHIVESFVIGFATVEAIDKRVHVDVILLEAVGALGNTLSWRGEYHKKEKCLGR